MTQQEFAQAIDALIDAWCDRRALILLREILPTYPLHSPLTDGWSDLADSLKRIRVLHAQRLAPGEFDVVVELLHAAEKIVYR
jgi:hypothetical protein